MQYMNYRFLFQVLMPSGPLYYIDIYLQACLRLYRHVRTMLDDISLLLTGILYYITDGA